jgi:hypothetical protein
MSKELFMAQREFEAMPVTKQTVKDKIKAVEIGLLNGTIEPKSAYIQAKVVKDIADGIMEQAKPLIKDTDTSLLPDNLNGIELSDRNGYEVLDYEKDSTYADLKAKLKEREGLLKAAYQHNQKVQGLITDESGEVIPVVPVKSFVSNSLTVKLP